MEGEGLASQANSAISTQGSGQRGVSTAECGPLTSHRDGCLAGSRVMYIGRMAAGPQHAQRCPRVALMEGLKVRPHPSESEAYAATTSRGGKHRGASHTRRRSLIHTYTACTIAWEGCLGMQTMASGLTPARRDAWEGLRVGSACLCRRMGAGLVAGPVWSGAASHRVNPWRRRQVSGRCVRRWWAHTALTRVRSV